MHFWKDSPTCYFPEESCTLGKSLHGFRPWHVCKSSALQCSHGHGNLQRWITRITLCDYAADDTLRQSGAISWQLKKKLVDGKDRRMRVVQTKWQKERARIPPIKELIAKSGLIRVHIVMAVPTCFLHLILVPREVPMPRMSHNRAGLWRDTGLHWPTESKHGSTFTTCGFVSMQAIPNDITKVMPYQSQVTRKPNDRQVPAIYVNQ